MSEWPQMEQSTNSYVRPTHTISITMYRLAAHTAHTAPTSLTRPVYLGSDGDGERNGRGTG
ncbi:hypothetical protein E2C01_045919 [Portunus trituberculatus]|uniref:Uncharacterized protein n=1 Tax=Portunus trituberculatus TaxID=210409 RepID=A0A5B7G394_PORTR|nr:hypothetical protein [Portunus trituberculatus]